MRTRRDLRAKYAYLADTGRDLIDPEKIYAFQLFLYHRREQEATWLVATGGYIDDLYISTFSVFDTRISSTHHLRDTDLKDGDFFSSVRQGKGTLFERFLKPFGGQNFAAKKFRIDNETDLVFNAIFTSRNNMKDDENKLVLSVLADLLAANVRYEIGCQRRDLLALMRLSPNVNPTRAVLLLSSDLKIVDRSAGAKKIMLASDAFSMTEDEFLFTQPLDRMWFNHAIHVLSTTDEEVCRRTITSNAGDVAGSLRLTRPTNNHTEHLLLTNIAYLVEFESFAYNTAARSAPSIFEFPADSSHALIASLVGQGASRTEIAELLGMEENRISREVSQLMRCAGVSHTDNLVKMATFL